MGLSKGDTRSFDYGLCKFGAETSQTKPHACVKKDKPGQAELVHGVV